MESSKAYFFMDDIYSRKTAEDIIREQEVEDAAASLIEILRNRPELRQFVTSDTVTNAARVIKSLRKILAKHPRILAEFAQASQLQKPGEVVMAVIPNEPLVLIQTGEEVTAFAPALVCTLNAIDSLFSNNHPQIGGHAIITSNNGLIPHVIQRLKKEDHPIISYDPKTMDPIDYIALGATGMFYNETFRTTIRQTK